LGAVSYENDEGTEPAQRQIAKYTCPNGHQLEVPFAADAQVPAVWECRFCGASARREDTGPPPAPKTKPARSHWDMLRERRSIPELEALLQERLAELRKSRGTSS
jgi:ribosomal protein L37AE/L43A